MFTQYCRFRLSVCFFCCLTFTTIIHAQSARFSPFRVDTDIYADNAKAPIKRTLTLFSDGIYYDFEEAEMGLITVIDPSRSRIVLLNRQRQVKATLDTNQVQKMVVNARTQSDAKTTAKIASISKSQFEKIPNGKEEAVVLNEYMEYRASTQQPNQPDMAHQYFEFANGSAQLNAIYQPKLPPYLRLELNRLIAERDLLPNEIRRITRQGGRQMELTCRIIPIWQLSQDDLVKIARCGAMLADFKEVSSDDYWSQNPVIKTATEASSTR